MVKKYCDLCRETREKIRGMDGEQASGIARQLVAFASGKTAEELIRDYALYATDSSVACTDEVVTRYLSGEPLAYILGEWSFFGLPMKVTKDVLIPRDDTQVVAALAMEEISRRGVCRVLDLCTGSGCIGIAVAHKIPQAKVTLADVSDAALRVAKENASINKLTGKLNVVKVDCTKPAPAFLGKYDVIISNPPYITGDEMKDLDPSVKDFEPHLALYGGEDGLEFYRHICRNFYDVLTDDGCLCFEFGMGQDTAVGEILRENNFENLLFCRDTSNIIRAVIARKKGKE